MPTSFGHRVRDREIIQRRQRRQLAVGLGFAIFGAIVAGGASWWESRHAVPADDFVKIYRVHGCSCAFTWANTLEKSGFTVRMVELETLRGIRKQLGTPKEFKGCHVATYLTYFVEDHVAPIALRKLAAERPGARGIATTPVVDSEQAKNPLLHEKSALLLL